MAMTVVGNEKESKQQKFSVIDCDIHNAIPSSDTLQKYMPKRWLEHHKTIGGRSRAGVSYPRVYPNAARRDAWPPSGLPPGSDLGFMQEQLLDFWNLEYGILNCLERAGAQLNLEYGAAMAQAINDWQIAEWTEPESRLRASIVVPYEDGELAAAEINRIGDHPGFVQVLVVVRTNEPLGRRKYWKMYEAAVCHNLPIGIHFGGGGGGPLTGAGWPSHYIEDHGGMPQAFQAQITSLVFEGVFESFPTLKFVLIEGGFAWLAPLIWRLDHCWKKLRVEVPKLKHPPSEYIRKNFWLTTQPMEEPPQIAYLEQFLEHLNMNDKLMFATDYPHWDFDAPNRILPEKFHSDLKQKVMVGNARKLYRL